MESYNSSDPQPYRVVCWVGPDRTTIRTTVMATNLMEAGQIARAQYGENNVMSVSGVLN